MRNGRPLSVRDIRPGLIMISGPCQCGLRVDVGVGSGGASFYVCCVPLRSPRTGEIVGYGAECRPTQVPDTAGTAGSQEQTWAVLADLGPPPPGMSTALYEAFDEDRIFLYVGVSDVLEARTRIHARRSTWAMFAAFGSVRWFANRADAEAEESAAIRERGPLFNRLHAQPGAREALIRYLVERGRTDLLEVTATWG